MSSTFTPTDRLDLHRILDLQRDQLKDGSMLADLMRDLELFDQRQGTELVDAVKNAIALHDSLSSQIQALEAEDGLRIVDVQGEIRTENFAPGAATAALRSRRHIQILLIKKYLDPAGHLERFVLTGRVIRTL